MSDHNSVLRELGWEEGLTLAGCNQCQLVSLLPAGAVEQRCFHCGSTRVEIIDPTTDLTSHLAPPELVVRQRLRGIQAAARLKEWGKWFFLQPNDAAHTALVSRLRLVYAPVWLMDTTVQTKWQAEVGFDYQVQSHRESYSGGSWRTQQVQRTKQDWEPRTGSMTLRFDNVPAEALERNILFARLVQRPIIGLQTVREADPYQPDTGSEASFCLPTRVPQDAVADMVPTLMEMAKNEVKSACRADHLRHFQWAPELSEQNWTKMLFPIWSTWYLDDDDRPRMIYINAMTGHGWGEKTPSMRRAWLFSGIFGGAAALLFVAGLILWIITQSVTPFFTLSAFGVLLLLIPLILILYVIYQKGRPDQFRMF